MLARARRPSSSEEVKKVLCSKELPFAECVSGAPSGDYLSRAILNSRGEHPLSDTADTADAADMGLTSCRWIR
jgi:hypothetical protein